ncbi:hypothetical protein WA026_015176 [Henosepilachna vigintioctopunctata]|uniref:Uncharacterized protein n=1 Tax=Henosepilachna vigintioctopunctata TaxID=420089 RepID=A0AAW1TUX2_9CUCU
MASEVNLSRAKNINKISTIISQSVSPQCIGTSIVINRDVDSVQHNVTDDLNRRIISNDLYNSSVSVNHDLSKLNSSEQSQQLKINNNGNQSNIVKNVNEVKVNVDDQNEVSWATIVKKKPSKQHRILLTGTKEVNPTSKVEGVVKRKCLYVGQISGNDATVTDMKNLFLNSSDTDDFVFRKTSN